MVNPPINRDSLDGHGAHAQEREVTSQYITQVCTSRKRETKGEAEVKGAKAASEFPVTKKKKSIYN